MKRLTYGNSASGLGRACVWDICKSGGNAAILDQNDGLASTLVRELGASAQFFNCDVLNTKSVATAVRGAVEWATQSQKPLGGVIAAAGVGGGATVRDLLCPVKS